MSLCKSPYRERWDIEREMVRDADDGMLRSYMGWVEFTRDLRELDPQWRRFCRNVRQELHKRGLTKEVK